MATGGNEIKASAAEHAVINIQHVENIDVQIVTIPRVPKRLRWDKDDAYEPMIISFGPYHRGQDGLKDMEEHKQRYVQAILSRCKSPHCDLQNKIQELEGVVRRCYSKDIGCLKEEKWKNGEFVDMMMRDGCFIVEYLLRFHEKISDELDSMIGVHRLLKHDILLLENQLPFFLLDHIFNHVKEHQEQSSQFTFMHLCIDYFKPMPSKDTNPQLPEPDHLLHLYHSFLVNANADIHNIGTETQQGRKENKICDAIKKLATSARAKVTEINAAAHTCRAKQREEKVPVMIPSATALHEHGITLKKNEAKESGNINILDIKFSNGVLEIPQLFIEDFTKSQFRNLIAFEQLYPRSKDGQFLNNFTAYIFFMDYIVNTPEDVALLCQKGILEHYLGSDKDVADLFNNLTKWTFRDPNHYLLKLFKDVKEYQNLLWPRWRANLMRNYFNTPWAGLSVAAAVFLLLLTIVQTVFSGMSTNF